MNDYYHTNHSLKSLLSKVSSTRKDCNNLLSILTIESVSKIFAGNPVLDEGVPKELRETNESYDTDKFISVTTLLQEASTTLLKAEKLLLRAGLHHVRFETGTRVPQRVEEED